MAEQNMLEAIAKMMQASGASLTELSEHLTQSGDGTTVREFYSAGMARMSSAARAKHPGVHRRPRRRAARHVLVSLRRLCDAP